MTSEREVYIYIQLPGTLETVPAALLRVQTLDDGTHIGRFRYGNRYQERHGAVELDPYHLPLGDDVYEFTAMQGIPGAVRDASPDSWGRRVIQYTLKKPEAELDELDYLLHGPQDGAGNLSFGLSAEPPAVQRKYNRTQQLENLVTAARAIEKGEPLPQALLEQIDPGTSLGGARPKATIEHDDTLWLGKFPSKDDVFNMQRVEYATLQLARACGLDAAPPRLECLANYDVLLVPRFDRQHTNDGYLRFGIVSGLTVLDATDSRTNRERWSYPLLADNLARWSTKPKHDCQELFRRMVFNAAVTNNDDHPRNHALIRRERGWQLTQAYDLVPVPAVSLERRNLAMEVGQFGRAGSIYNLVSEATRFRFSPEAARSEINRIADVIKKDWRQIFHDAGVSEKDIRYIEPAMVPESFFLEVPPDPVLII